MSHDEHSAGGVPPSPLFSPGDLLAGRFRVIAFLNEGAVGEVYEAEDSELKVRVAVKVLRPEIAHNPVEIERFRREIHLAREVTHRNVCRTFDLFRHREVVFLTMELVRGETLAERLARAGPLSPEEALPIVRQMAEALAAAHEVGVIHRDFKSENVILSHSGSGLRVVVTDFGLAVGGSAEGDGEARLTTTGHLVGSPAYMAPEQVRAEEVTRGTDVYALGVVMYEMLTGELPFVGETAFATAVKRLTEPPPSLRARRADLDPVWEEVILRCLRPDPAGRFSNPMEVPWALMSADSTRVPLSRSRRRRRAGWAGAAVGLAVVAAALATWVGGIGVGNRAGEPSRAGATEVRRAVMVLGFDNRTGLPELDWVGDLLTAALPAELAAGGRLRAVAGERVFQIKRDLDVTRVLELVGDTRQRLVSLTGTDLLIRGSYALEGPEETSQPLFLEAWIEEGDGEGRIAVVGEPAAAGELPAAVGRLGEALRRRRGGGRVPGQQRAALAASRPAGLEAARLWAEGYRRLHRGEARVAADALERAAAADPESARIRLSLADALAELGEVSWARGQASLAVAAAGELPTADRLHFEARQRELAQDWEGAAERYRQLLELFPDDLEAGLALAAAEIAGGDLDRAGATLDGLRALPSPLGKEPRIDLAAARLAGAAGSFEEQRVAAARVAAAADARGDRHRFGEARLLQGQALIELGRPREALAPLREARQLFLLTGDLPAAAVATRWQGRAHYAGGDPEAAWESLEEALAACRRIGHRGEEAQVLAELAGVLWVAGRKEEGAVRYREALALARALGDRRQEARVLHQLAVRHEQSEEYGQAAELYLAAVAIHQETGDEESLGLDLHGAARSLATAGDLDTARRLESRALEIFRRRGDRLAAAKAERNLGWLAQQQGDLPLAGRHFDQALADYRAAGERTGEALVLNDLALLLRGQDQLWRAEQLFAEVAELYREVGSASGQAAALANLGGVQAGRGRLEEAEEALRRAVALNREAGDRRGLARTWTRLARLRMDRGALAEAEELVREALALLRELETTGEEPYALHALARIHLARGKLGAARSRLEEALEARLQLGRTLEVARDRLVLAQVAYQEGRFEAAERTAEAARSELHAQRAVGDEARALLLIGRCRLARGSLAEARQALADARRRVEASEDLSLRAEAALADALLLAAREPSAALPAFRQALAEAEATGRVPLVLEARLALGKAEQAAGLASGEERLAAVASEAESLGFAGLAARATGERRSKPPPTSAMRLAGRERQADRLW